MSSETVTQQKQLCALCFTSSSEFQTSPCIHTHDSVQKRNGGGWVVRWCWVNFQYRGVLLIWIIVGQEPTALAVDACGGCLDIFSLIYHFSVRSPSLWNTARYRLKCCLKGPLSPKQPTNQQKRKNDRKL